MPAADFEQAVDLLQILANKMEVFVTGDTSSTIVTDGGVIPSLSKFIHDKDADINVGASSILALSTMAKDQAQIAEVGAASAWTDFRKLYYGPLASDPAFDPLGAAPTPGDSYFNTTDLVLRYFNGTIWYTPNASAAGAQATADQAVLDAAAAKAAADAAQATGNAALPKAGGSLTGSVNEAKAASVASAASPDIWAGNGNVLHITGTVAVTGFPAAPQAGSSRRLICDAAVPFTAGANMVITGVASGSSIITAAGDIVDVLADTAVLFRLRITKLSGAAVSAPVYVQARQAPQYGPATGLPAVSDIIPQSQINNTLAVGVTCKFSVAPTLLSGANGFNADGSNLDVNVIETVDRTLANLTASSTNLIVYDLVNKALVKSVLLDTETKGGTPAITNGQYTFDSFNMKMYLGDGTTANRVSHLIVAEVDTDTTKVIAVRCRAYQAKADTGWFAVGANNLYNPIHNVGTANCRLELQFNQTAANDANGFTEVPQYAFAGASSGAARTVNKNTVTIRVGDTYVFSNSNMSGGVINAPSGYYRAHLTRRY